MAIEWELSSLFQNREKRSFWVIEWLHSPIKGQAAVALRYKIPHENGSFVLLTFLSSGMYFFLPL